MSSIIRLTDLQSPNVTNGLNIDATTGLLNQNIYGFNVALSPLGFTPSGKTKVVFTMSNSDQTFVVPSGKTYILVKCWGAGGGSGQHSGWYSSGSGGGGGFSRGIIPVTPGETLTIRVGRGGYCPGALLSNGTAVAGATTPGPYGGGTATTTSSDTYGGYGGGYCGIFRGSSPLLMAGAGGGGGANNVFYCGAPNGGAGGGTYGLRGDTMYYFNLTTFAEGGTQSAGGVGASVGYYAQGNGSSLQGGSVQGLSYGGGGGGGYYGGGAGNYMNAQGAIMVGGGGGSGYVGSTVIFGQSFTGKGMYPAGMDDPDYPPSTASTYTSVGFGGFMEYSHGGDSYLTLYY
jgi:hypothetical protein